MPQGLEVLHPVCWSHSRFARSSRKSCVPLSAQRGEYTARYASRLGRRLASLAEGRGLSVITVSGLRGLRLFPLRSNRARRAILFLLRAIWWWVKSFFSVGLGGARFRAPLVLPVLIPRVKKRSSRRRLRAGL